MAQLIEAIPHLVQRIFTSVLGILLVAWMFVLLASLRKSVMPIFAPSGRDKRVPPVQWLVILVVMSVCTLFSGKNTNGVQGVGGPLTQLNPSVFLTVTQEEITQGYRLESVTTNEAVSYAKPTNGVKYAPWSLRGGRETHFPLDLGDFAFPFGTGVVHRLDVLSGGMVKSFPRPSYMSICAARDWASLIPGESGFWWADSARSASAPYQGTNQIKLLTWEGVYEGMIQSGSEEDVRVTGALTPIGGAQSLTADARLTAVGILFKPVVEPPKDAASGRHEYGVCELVEHYQFPSAPAVTWNPVGGGSNTVSSSGQPCFSFPLYGCENPLRVELGSVSYVPRLSCIEPSGIVSGKVELCTYGLPPGKAGGIGLLQEFYVTPFTVSFSRIAIEEVPCDRGTVEGYFLYGVPSNRWTHTRAAGAGRWHNVSVHNRVGEDHDVLDEACLGGELFPITPDGTLTNDYSYGWMDGTMVWQVPFGWNALDTEGETEPFKTFGALTQEFYIDDSGCSGVRKFGNQALRLIDDRRFLGIREIFTNIVLEAR